MSGGRGLVYPPPLAFVLRYDRNGDSTNRATTAIMIFHIGLSV